MLSRLRESMLQADGGRGKVVWSGKRGKEEALSDNLIRPDDPGCCDRPAKRKTARGGRRQRRSAFIKEKQGWIGRVCRPSSFLFLSRGVPWPHRKWGRRQRKEREQKSSGGQDLGAAVFATDGGVEGELCEILTSESSGLTLVSGPRSACPALGLLHRCRLARFIRLDRSLLTRLSRLKDHVGQRCSCTGTSQCLILVSD